MYEVRFTKIFTGGNLEGTRFETSITFLSHYAAMSFIDMAREFLDIRKPCAGSPYRIEDVRLVSEDAAPCHIWNA